MRVFTLRLKTMLTCSRCEYPDDKCVQILEQLKPQLISSPASSVLINEVTVPRLPSEPQSHDIFQNRQSLLPQMTSLMQLHSIAFLGLKERTYEEYETLFSLAEYSVTGFYDLHLYTSLFELSLTQEQSK